MVQGLSSLLSNSLSKPFLGIKNCSHQSWVLMGGKIVVLGCERIVCGFTSRSWVLLLKNTGRLYYWRFTNRIGHSHLFVEGQRHDFCFPLWKCLIDLGHNWIFKLWIKENYWFMNKNRFHSHLMDGFSCTAHLYQQLTWPTFLVFSGFKITQSF